MASIRDIKPNEHDTAFFEDAIQSVVFALNKPAHRNYILKLAYDLVASELTQDDKTLVYKHPTTRRELNAPKGYKGETWMACEGKMKCAFVHLTEYKHHHNRLLENIKYGSGVYKLTERGQDARVELLSRMFRNAA